MQPEQVESKITEHKMNTVFSALYSALKNLNVFLKTTTNNSGRVY